MNTPPSSPDRPNAPVPEKGAHGGIEITGGDVRAARDIVAGDENITIQRGYSAKDVQRIALMVGGLVFITAACFFIFGAVSAAALVGVINRPLPNGSSPQAAQEMQSHLQVIQAKAPGESFEGEAFTEDQVSSYFRFVLGPKLGISDGRARLMEQPGQIALGGNLDRVGGLPFLAQLNLTTGETPLVISGAWVKILPTAEGSAFGWVPVTPLAQSLTNQINDSLFGHVVFTRIEQRGSNVSAPNIRGALAVWGTVK